MRGCWGGGCWDPLLITGWAWGSPGLQGKCAESRIAEAEVSEPGVGVWGVNPVSSLPIDPMTQALVMSLRSG